MTQDAAGTPAETPAQELERLRAELAVARRARMDAARSAARRTSVEIAIEAAVRDRDAGMSPQLAELRQQGQVLAARLRKVWADADWIRGAVARLNAAGFAIETDPNIAGGQALIRHLLAEELHRGRVRSELEEADVVALRVPSVAPMAVRARENREQIAAALDEVVRAQAEHEARRSRPTSRRDHHLRGGDRG